MSCLQVPAPAAMRAWRRGLISARRLRSGHVDVVVVQGRQPAGLRKEVRTCEYTDVHVMWEMLSKPSTSTSSKGAAAGHDGEEEEAHHLRRVAAAWSRLTFYCCGII